MIEEKQHFIIQRAVPIMFAIGENENIPIPPRYKLCEYIIYNAYQEMGWEINDFLKCKKCEDKLND